MIPGAFEIRDARPSPRPTTSGTTPRSDVPTPIVHDRARLEHEREGGGAPGERTGKTRLSRIAHGISLRLHRLAGGAMHP